MDWAKVSLKILGAAVFLFFMVFLLSDVLAGGSASPINVVGAVLGPVIFLFAGRLAAVLDPLLQRLRGLRRGPAKIQPAKYTWGGPDSAPPAEPAPPAATPQRETQAAGSNPTPAPAGQGIRWHLPKLHRPVRKYRIPGFRALKRWTAAFLMVFDFVVGEIALTGPGSQAYSVFFLANSFLLADYLWKTRKQEVNA